VACPPSTPPEPNTKTRPDEKYEKAQKQRLAEAVLVAIDPDVDVALEESET
jgi:hypothetical protein